MLPPLRFLVIEDDHDTREIIAFILRVQGYDVQVAETRDKALELCAAFDVIVMDYMMPGTSAFLYCEKIREQSPQTRIILTTAGNIAQTRAEFLGIATFVAKPFTPAELIAAVDAVKADGKEHELNTAAVPVLPRSDS